MRDWTMTEWLYAVMLAALLTFAALQPRFEAEAYTRLTGKRVTYWDAVWLDLRIQEQVRP